MSFAVYSPSFLVFFSSPPATLCVAMRAGIFGSSVATSVFLGSSFFVSTFASTFSSLTGCGFFSFFSEIVVFFAIGKFPAFLFSGFSAVLTGIDFFSSFGLTFFTAGFSAGFATVLTTGFFSTASSSLDFIFNFIFCFADFVATFT